MALFWLLLCLRAPLPVQAALSSPGVTNEPVLTNIAQVLELSPAQAIAERTVRVRGVLTCYEHGNLCFVQDPTGGVFVYYAGARLPLRAGDYVEVAGHSDLGRYTPIIRSTEVQVTERGAPVHPRKASLAEILRGGLDAQWVEVEGMLRGQDVSGAWATLTLTDSPHRLTVWVPQVDGLKAPGWGTRVRARGVVVMTTNDDREALRFQLFVPSPAELMALSETPEAEAAPLRSVAELNSYYVRTPAPGPVKLEGVVTARASDSIFYLQDSTGGIEVRMQTPTTNLLEGTRLLVWGFPGPMLESARVEDAQLRELGGGEMPEAKKLAPGQLAAGEHHLQLASIEATLLRASARDTNGLAMTLKAGKEMVTALLRHASANDLAARLAAGTILRLEGVFRAEPGEEGEPRLTLLLRSPADIQVLSQPVRQEQPRAWLIPGLLGLSVSGLVLALVINYRQRQQTEHVLRLQAGLQAEMREGEKQLRRSMDERERIGRDLHDDIIQSIYAVGLGLEDCKRVVEGPARSRLQVAIQALNNTISSVRGFIAGLEPKVLNGGEFRTALKSLALTSGESTTQFTFQVDAASANLLTSMQATQLLHIAKEAMSNALRHAQASMVAITLRPENGGIRLQIEDDGIGCQPASTHNAGQGLRNMTARARGIGGDLQMISAPGQGCCIVVSVPHPNANERS